MNATRPSRATLAVLCAAVSGCSTVTPNFTEPGQQPMDTWLSEQHVINHIQCQLAQAVRSVVDIDRNNASNIPDAYRASWINDWGAKVSLVLAVNNKDNLSPGITFTHPLENAVKVFSRNGNVTVSRNRGFGLGASFSADATRTETIGFFYPFKALLESPIDVAKCKTSEGTLLSSDLKIADFIEKGVNISYQPGVIVRKAGEAPYQTFTYEVKFIVTRSANLNPSFKLVEIAANQSGTLYATSRIRTDDLTITMGKVETKDGKATPSAELEQQHLANLIGQAVANSLQNLQPQ